MSELNVRLFETLFSDEEVRVNRMILAPGEETPWHFHTNIRDTFYVLCGPVTILTHDPDSTTTVDRGQMFQTIDKQPHRMLNQSDHDVSVVVIQGIGKYDFNLLPTV